MPKRQNQSDIGHAINRFLKRPNPVLFAGAGVGVRVGFPAWNEFVEELASVCERHNDSASANLIRDRLARGNYLEAASVYKTNDIIPVGERMKYMAAPFSKAVGDDTLDRLVPLVGLGFSAIITTNYDRSLLDAWSSTNHRAPLTLDRGGLSGGSLGRDFYVARIHGKAENPPSMVIDLPDYERLDRDDDYLDFILDILRRRSALFIGFSFLDPAIDRIMTVYKKRCGPTYQSLHSALIPQGQSDLENRLRDLNIESLLYDPDDDHIALWRGIRDAYDASQEQVEITPKPKQSIKLLDKATHRFLAFAYAQVTTRPQATPLAISVHDGIVASVLSRTTGGDTSLEDLVSEVAALLSLSQDQVLPLVRGSIERLSERDQLIREGDLIIWGGEDPKQLQSGLSNLAQDVADRMLVREGIHATLNDLAVATEALEETLNSRAWDLAAHLAGAAIAWSGDDENVVKNAVLSAAHGKQDIHEIPLIRGILNLLRRPDEKESSRLTAVARSAFGVQLLLASPRQTVLHRYALPQRVYLDANVLLPIITKGHPLRPVYTESLSRFADAAAKSNADLSVAVGQQFLNEVVSHRRLAKELVQELELDDPDALTQHIMFRGALNTNVFIGAFASFVGRNRAKMPFSRFLANTAPYEDEADLARFLVDQQIDTVSMDFTEDHNSTFTRAFSSLQSAYELSSNMALHGRISVLIRHEAQQLVQLELDSQKGLRSLFVTADTRLRRAIKTESSFAHLADLTTSHIGLVALADVFVGAALDPRSLARLIWAVFPTEKEQSLFDYFIDMGLRQYDEGLGVDLSNAAEIVAEEASVAADTEGVQLFGNRKTDVAQTAKFLDRFEERFYELWRKAIDQKSS